MACLEDGRQSEAIDGIRAWTERNSTGHLPLFRFAKRTVKGADIILKTGTGNRNAGRRSDEIHLGSGGESQDIKPVAMQNPSALRERSGHAKRQPAGKFPSSAK